MSHSGKPGQIVPAQLLISVLVGVRGNAMKAKMVSTPVEIVAVGVGNDKELRITSDQLDRLLSEPIPRQIGVRNPVVLARLVETDEYADLPACGAMPRTN